MKVISLDPALRSFGVYTNRDGVETSEVKRIPASVDRLDALGRLLSWLSKLSAPEKEWDLCIVEAYAFSGGRDRGQNSRSVTIQAEVGGIARGLFVARKVPVIEIPIGVWKAVTGIRMEKGTALHKSAYLNAVRTVYGKDFATTDEVDAFLFYQTVRKCGIGPAIGDGPVRIKRKLEDLKINAEEM